MVNQEFIHKVCAHFFPDFTEMFTIRALATKSGISYDATYRLVHYLIEKNVLIEQKIGAYSYIGLNTYSQRAMKIVEAISVEKTEQFLEKNKGMKIMLLDLVEQLKSAAPNELISVVLFGSYAKGTQNQHSDVDMLILVSSFDVMDELENVSDAVGVGHGYDVSPIITTLSEYADMLKSKKPYVADGIKRDGIVLQGFEPFFSTSFEVAT